MEKEKKERISGNLGKIFDDKEKKDYTIKEFESGKKVLNLKLKPNNEDWKTLAVWNEVAERTKQAINEGFKKFTFTGTNKVKEHGEKQYPYFEATDMAKMKAVEIEGKITSVRDKEAGNKKIQEALVVESKEVEGSKYEKTYQVVVWPETNGAKDTSLVAGNNLAVHGEATFLDGGKKEYVSIQSYDIAQDKDVLKSIMDEKAASRKAEPEKAKEDKTKEVKTKEVKPKAKKEATTKKTTAKKKATGKDEISM